MFLCVSQAATHCALVHSHHEGRAESVWLHNLLHNSLKQRLNRSSCYQPAQCQQVCKPHTSAHSQAGAALRSDGLSCKRWFEMPYSFLELRSALICHAKRSDILPGQKRGGREHIVQTRRVHLFPNETTEDSSERVMNSTRTTTSLAEPSACKRIRKKKKHEPAACQ